MPFEELDNKAREAASQYHPPYNEQAWGNMQRLLDAHLPQDKTRRRWFLWLLPAALLLGGSVWLFTSKPWKKSRAQEPEAAVLPVNTATQPGAAAANMPAGNHTSASTSNNNIPQPVNRAEEPAGDELSSNAAPASLATATLPNRQNAGHLPVQPAIAGSGRRNTGFTRRATPPGRMITTTGNTGGRQKNKQEAAAVMPDAAAITADNNQDAETKINNNTEYIPATANETAATPAATAPVEKKEPAVPAVNAQPQKTAAAKKKNGKGGQFSISLSAGPDISQAGNGRPGTMRPLFGAGIGYSITPRLLLRTGIYATDKIYTASPAEYKPDAPINYPGYDLTNISASCRVLQAPVTVSYLFPAGKRNNLLLSAGVASVWMKREIYVYDFKSTYGGYTRSHTYTYNNENRHPFSMFSFSAGFQRRLGNRFSLLAEPYITMPLNGIGNGNVKLKSAGLQLSVAALPFKKK